MNTSNIVFRTAGRGSADSLAWIPLTLINELTVKEVVDMTRVDRCPKGFPRELDAFDLRTGKNLYGRANIFGAPARKLLLICRMEKANKALLVGPNVNPGVRTQPLHLLPAAWG